MTKVEAVRQALTKLGNEAMPTAIQTFIKDSFSIEMSKDHISVCKGKILRMKPAKGRKTTAVAASPAPKRTGANGIVVEDILALKELADRVGPDQLLGLIDALAK